MFIDTTDLSKSPSIRKFAIDGGAVSCYKVEFVVGEIAYVGGITEPWFSIYKISQYIIQN
jgi:hypothetical protein